MQRHEPACPPKVRGAMFVKGDHWVNNQRLVLAYAQAAAAAGVELRSGATVTASWSRVAGARAW